MMTAQGGREREGEWRGRSGGEEGGGKGTSMGETWILMTYKCEDELDQKDSFKG